MMFTECNTCSIFLYIIRAYIYFFGSPDFDGEKLLIPANNSNMNTVNLTILTHGLVVKLALPTSCTMESGSEPGGSHYNLKRHSRRPNDRPTIRAT